MSTKAPRKASSTRKKRKGSITSIPKQLPIDSQVPSYELEGSAEQMEPNTTIYGHGDFQRLICCFTIVALVVLQCHNHSFALLTRPVDHWCQSPSHFANFSAPKWKNIGIPVNEEGRHSECLAYAQPGQQPNDTETYECDVWDYDPARAAQSAISYWNLVCRRSWLLSLGNAVYMGGAFLVVPLAGYVADKVGRKTVIFTGVAMILTGTLATCTVRTYSFYLVAKFVNSACASSIFVVSLILLYEVAPLSYRVFYISISCALGIFLVDMLLFLLAPFPLSWSLLQAVVLSPTVLLLLSTCAVHESPVWLLVTSRVDEARAVMLVAATMNNVSRVVVKQAVLKVKTELSHSNTPNLIGTALAAPNVKNRSRHIVRVLVGAFLTMMGIYGLAWSERMRKSTTVKALAAILSAPSYVAMYIGLVSLGRLQLLLIVMSLMGGTCCLRSFAINATPRLVSDGLLVFAQCCARVLVPSAYLYAAELFPTGVRCAVLCGAYAFGRLGAVAASALSLFEEASREDIEFAILGSALLVSVAVMLGLPETSYGLVDARTAETDKDVLKIMQYTEDTTPRPRHKRKRKLKP